MTQDVRNIDRTLSADIHTLHLPNIMNLEACERPQIGNLDILSSPRQSKSKAEAPKPEKLLEELLEGLGADEHEFRQSVSEVRLRTMFVTHCVLWLTRDVKLPCLAGSQSTAPTNSSLAEFGCDPIHKCILSPVIFV